MVSVLAHNWLDWRVRIQSDWRVYAESEKLTEGNRYSSQCYREKQHARDEPNLIQLEEFKLFLKITNVDASYVYKQEDRRGDKQVFRDALWSMRQAILK